MPTGKQKRDNVTMEHINAQSLLANKDEVELLLNERNVDILCVSETWLTPNVPSEYVSISNYHLYRSDAGRGGGVCMYVKNVFKVTPLVMDIVRPSGVEDIWVSVQVNKLPSIIVGCMYRHPKSNSDTFDYFREVLYSVILRKKSFYLLGDFNDDLLSDKSKVKHIISNAKLTSLITTPTRIASTSATLLDTIVTNQPDAVLQSSAIPCSIADHELITVTTNLRRPNRTPVIKTFRELRNYSQDIFCNLLLLETHKLNEIFANDTVDLQVHIFTETFNNCLNKCAPIVTKEIKRPSAPWMNDDLKRLIQERNNVHKFLKIDRNNEELQYRYNDLKKRVKRSILTTKKEYYNKKLEGNKGNTSAIWKTLRELIPATGSKNKIAPAEDAETVKSKADAFNYFFANVGKNTFNKSRQLLANEAPLNDTNVQNITANNMFRPQPIDWQTVVLTIKHLKKCDSYGCDGVPLKFLKDSLHVLIHYITCILNTSIVTGTFPTLWKQATIIPILKAGDADDPQNFRPISLLPIISKVLEKIISCQLTNYLEENNLLKNTQHGFRSRLSTETALLTLSNTLYKNIDNKKLSLITLLDLSKAFDSVSPTILLNKLINMGIDIFWFENYLSKRTQQVRMGEILSNTLEISFGVPQGSVLGPILFTIYVNDFLDFFTDCVVIQYADDTQLIHTGTVDHIEELISRSEQTLKRARNYFLKNGLLMNTKKTQCMFVGSRKCVAQIPPGTSIKIEDSEIRPSKAVKNLGVYFDEFMTFEKHIDEICKKMFGITTYINRVRENLCKDARTTAIQALVLSNINYCIKVWGSTNATHLQRVQRAQNFAAKVALGGGAKRDHVTPFIKELGWFKISFKYKYEICIMIYKILNSNTPSYLMKLPTVKDTRPVCTRQQNQLFVPKTRTCTGARSVQVAGPRLWNSLPLGIRDANTVFSFKRKLYNYILQEQFSGH